jgi:hypothetical protein
MVTQPITSIPFNVFTGALLDESVRNDIRGRKTFVQEDIGHRDVMDIRGVGPKIKASLRRLGVRTIGQFATMDARLVPAGFAGVHAALAASITER